MKKYIKFIVFLFFIASVISCDDYLKTESNSQFVESTSFSNLDFAQKVVNGSYYCLTSVYTYGCYSLFYNMDNDIEWSIAADNGGVYNIAHYSTLPGVDSDRKSVV